ncbi:unnamed protein product, partial [Didymodactylos carnosus]
LSTLSHEIKSSENMPLPDVVIPTLGENAPSEQQQQPSPPSITVPSVEE